MTKEVPQIKKRTENKRINPYTGKPMTVVRGEVDNLTIGEIVPEVKVDAVVEMNPQLKEVLEGKVVNVNRVQPK